MWNYEKIAFLLDLEGFFVIIEMMFSKVEEVAKVWRWHSNQKKDRDLKFMVSDQEWAQQAEEKYWLQED